MNFSTLLKVYCGAILIFPCSNANARHLTPEEALQRAESKSSAMRMRSGYNYDLVYSEANEGQDRLYVFNKADKGFIIVSADDSMPAILGYSDNGGFDYDNAAPALKWWLSQYAQEALYIPEIAVAGTQANQPDKAPESSDYAPIPYMIQTKWDQGNPYNMNCPEKNDTKCVTGCIATAMAQVVRYYGYPQRGNDTNSYQWNDTTLSYDYAAAEFLYDDMPYIYSEGATEEQKQAIADLMYACGVAVNMDYNLFTPGSNTENGSSASDLYIPYALRNYFKYDNAVRYLKKSFFSSEEWEDILYTELSSGRPVIYGGHGPQHEGHQFICDGYEGKGYFHINWGWSGAGDGFYLLTALDPKFQGAGGGGGPYNYDQTMICGIQPPVNDSKIWYPIYANGSIIAKPNGNTAVEITFTEKCGIHNYSQESVDVILEIKAISEDGKEYISDNKSSITFHAANGLTISGYGRIGSVGLPTKLPAGNYKCYLAFKTPEGNIQDVLFPNTTAAYFNLSVNSTGNITCSPGEPEAKAEIRISGFEVIDEAVAGQTAKVYVKIENIGEVEYSGAVFMKIFNRNSNETIANYKLSFGTIAPEGKFEGYVSLIFKFDPGDYDVIFFDQNNEKISEIYTLSVAESGVDGIFSENELTDVYSAGGILIKKNADKATISSLPKGIYILNSKGKNHKIIK